MTQYSPVDAAGPLPGHVDSRDYERLLEWLEELGIEEGFCQEPSPGNDPLPDFSRTNPFPPELASPVWTWKTGLVP
jgi:putative pyruvate formate lyase activating enzyme